MAVKSLLMAEKKILLNDVRIRIRISSLIFKKQVETQCKYVPNCWSRKQWILSCEILIIVDSNVHSDACINSI